MHVLALTILISLCLAGIFIVSFSLESKRRRRGSGSPEHDALLPFDDQDTPAVRPPRHLPPTDAAQIPEVDTHGR